MVWPRFCSFLFLVHSLLSTNLVSGKNMQTAAESGMEMVPMEPRAEAPEPQGMRPEEMSHDHGTQGEPPAQAEALKEQKAKGKFKLGEKIAIGVFGFIILVVIVLYCLKFFGHIGGTVGKALGKAISSLEIIGIVFVSLYAVGMLATKFIKKKTEDGKKDGGDAKPADAKTC